MIRIDEFLLESLTPQERIQKYNADLVKKNLRIRDIQKRIQGAQQKGNISRVNILKLEMQIVQLDIQKLRSKIKKEQLKTRP